jgi:putative membrane protein
MPDRPHFLDEDPPPARTDGTAAQLAPPVADLRAGPVLLEPEPDAPATLGATWRPRDLVAQPAPAGSIPWAALGVSVVLASLVMLSAIAFILDMAQRSAWFGAAAGLTLGLGLGLIGYGFCVEWRSYRQLRTVDRTRAALSRHDLSVEPLRAAALCWLGQVSNQLPAADQVAGAIRSASTVMEIQALLRNRAADPLRQAARAIGQRAAVQTASLIVISPHASWDGLIAGLRGLLVMRAVARLFGLRPGLAMTAVLVRKVAWTAAGTAGIELLSQSLADQLLGAVPVLKHIAATIPGGSVAAIRLYRLASITAEACCRGIALEEDLTPVVCGESVLFDGTPHYAVGRGVRSSRLAGTIAS